MSKEDKIGTMKYTKPNYGAITGVRYNAPVIPKPVVANYGSVTGGSTGVDDNPPAPTTYGAILSQLEQARQGARDQAQVNYNQATTGANAQYDRAKSNYGATADALVRSGLANSGYSNNIDAAAYAARARQLEGAQSNYGQALLNADKAYNEGVVAAEMGRQAKYEDILKAIGAGTITPAQGAQIGKDYGLTPEQQAGVDSTVNQAQNDSYAYYVNQLGSGGYVDFATVDADTYMTPEQKQDIKDRSLANIATAFASGDSANFANILNTLDANKGNMDEKDYWNAYEAYGERLVKDALDEDALKESGIDPIAYKGEVITKLKELRDLGKITPKAYKDLKNQIGSTVQVTQGFWQRQRGNEREPAVNLEIDGKKYGVVLSDDLVYGDILHPRTLGDTEEARALEEDLTKEYGKTDGNVVIHDGGIYVYWNGKWRIARQDGQHKSDYGEAYKLISERED